MAFDTALTILEDTAVELGLVTSLSAGYTSTEASIVQLRKLLKRVGRQLARARQWNHLQREHTFTTSATAYYSLPSDFRAMLDQTGWNRTDDSPLGGPLSPQQWQYLNGVSASPVLDVYFRPWQGRFYVYPSTDTGTSVAFEYLTSFWVQASGQSAPNKDAPTADTDTICLDAPLVICALKLAFLREKGFDATSAQQDFDEAWALATSDDAAAPILSLDGSPLSTRLIDGDNVPESGFGS